MGLGAAAFAYMVYKDESTPKERQLVYTMTPGVSYMVYTDGGSYWEEVAQVTRNNVGESMRNGGTLLRIEEVSVEDRQKVRNA